MNTRKATRTPRAILAIRGAQAARRHIWLTAIIRRQLALIAPGTTGVRIFPACQTVILDGAHGHPTADAQRDAHRLLRNVYPDADWSRSLAYDVRTGHITPGLACAPSSLTTTGAAA
ncbi:hypothetical protein ACH4JZ_18505 [Streptomyces sp. NPDC017615]|uniref:hypothetical protein n=1 Tax=Streptomyces sp. NPDC017615 TaxID=3365003 RepID=UPI00378897FC